jgi:phosphotransferase system enzyme I (PtsI)
MAPPAKEDTPQERVFTGLGVSYGVAAAKAFLVDLERPKVPERKLAPGEAGAEQARFEAAVAKARAELEALKAKSAALPESAGGDVALLLDAHLAMISGSRLVRGALKAIAEQNVNAEWALDQVMRGLSAQFRALKDPYIALRIDDVEAVGNRVQRALLGIDFLPLDSVPEGGIAFAREISPADTALLDPRRLAGFATVLGGAAGHTAVVARALGLPAVQGLDPALLTAAVSGGSAIVDGIEGKVILNPAPATAARYEKRIQELKQEKEELATLRQLPAATRDGAEIVLRANLELPREIDSVRASGARGVGLFRTEFLFMNRATLPGEEEQFQAFAAVVKTLGGDVATLRTLDIGGDKLAAALGDYLAEGPNPALGLRAIRLSLKEPHLLETQFRAMLRAAALGPVRILLPMVTTAEEVEHARAILVQCFVALKKSGAAVPDKLPPLGTMIEIPAAALSADSLAAVSDFFALGTNDLVQYTVAIDRADDQVAALYNPLNPAVLRLLEFSIEAGKRAGIPVSLCGEMGADPLYTPLLLGLGIREFSMGVSSLPRLKRRIRALSLAKAEEHARQVMDQYDPARIKDLVSQFRP